MKPVPREEGDVPGVAGEGLHVAIERNETDLGVATDAIVQFPGIEMPMQLAQPAGAKSLRGDGDPVLDRELLFGRPADGPGGVLRRRAGLQHVDEPGVVRQ